jgi:hypothetical protein
LPDTKVKIKTVLSDKFFFKFWKTEMEQCGFATDGNGIFKYKMAGIHSFNTKKNGLTDNIF